MPIRESEVLWQSGGISEGELGADSGWRPAGSAASGVCVASTKASSRTPHAETAIYVRGGGGCVGTSLHSRVGKRQQTF